MTMASWK